MPPRGSAGHGQYNPYDPAVFQNLSPEAQQNYFNAMSPDQQQAFAQQMQALGISVPGSEYSNNDANSQAGFLGALSNFFSGFSSGGGGHGGGGGGGGIPPDIGAMLGLSRDQLNAQRSQLDSNYGFSQQQDMLAQAGLNSQIANSKSNFVNQKNQFMGQSAARGANTTAGAGTARQQMLSQFQYLMGQLNNQNQNLAANRDQTNRNYMYGVQDNTFGQEGLNTQASNAGYQNPFSGVPGPVPVQKKV